MSTTPTRTRRGSLPGADEFRAVRGSTQRMSPRSIPRPMTRNGPAGRLSAMSSGTAFTLTPPSPESAVDWRARARKLAIPAALAVAVVIGAVVLGGPARTFLHALERAVEANPLWVVAGVAFEVLSFGGYVLLLWHVAGRDAKRLGFRESYQVTMAGLVATRLLPTAGMGGAALTLWSLQRAGHRGRDGARTLLTFLVILYSVFLGTILVVGALTAFGVLDASGPLALSAVPAGLAGVAIVTALWLSGRPA